MVTPEDTKKMMEQKIGIDITLMDAIVIVANIQLALRNPKHNGPGASYAERLARKLQREISVLAPEHEVVLEMGWNPLFDITDS